MYLYPLPSYVQQQAKIVTVNATITQYTVCGLRPFRLYSFTIQVVNEDQIGPPSSPRSTMTDESSEYQIFKKP